jgi:PEP-CTERM/exosortase A-associated glycosyltransferase
MTLRILHVLDHSVPLHSGYSFRTLAILKEQRALGWDTIQLTSTKHYGATQDEEQVEGFLFHRTRVPAGGIRSLPVVNQAAVIFDTARRLGEIIDRTRPDIVHPHSPCLNGIAALQAARQRRIPVVYEMRSSWEDAAVDYGRTTATSPRYRLSRALETWTLRQADAVTTICDGLRAEIVSRGIPADKVSVIPNAVDPRDFPWLDGRDAQLVERFGLHDAFTIGFAGSFYGYEGLDTLIEALPAILQVEPRTRVLLVGGGMEEERLKAQAHALGLGNKVIFAGRVPHSDVARYYSVIDLLAYPRKSIRLTETVTPLKPLEAMSQGRILIASDVGGHRELVRDGETGFLFRPDDPCDLARVVGEVLARRNEWERIRAAGRRFVESERTWRASVARYAGAYARVCPTAGRQ